MESILLKKENYIFFPRINAHIKALSNQQKIKHFRKLQQGVLATDYTQFDDHGKFCDKFVSAISAELFSHLSCFLFIRTTAQQTLSDF